MATGQVLNQQNALATIPQDAMIAEGTQAFKATLNGPDMHEAIEGLKQSVPNVKSIAPKPAACLVTANPESLTVVQ